MMQRVGAAPNAEERTVTEPPTTRHNRGEGDHATETGVEELYAKYGRVAPWLLLWEDGHTVLGPDGKPMLAPVVQRPPVGRSERYWSG